VVAALYGDRVDRPNQLQLPTANRSLKWKDLNHRPHAAGGRELECVLRIDRSSYGHPAIDLRTIICKSQDLIL
jgi:hypothetical protein